MLTITIIAMTGGEAVLSVVIGVATGLTSSLLLWVWLTHIMKPKVAWCPTAATYQLDDDHVIRTQVRLNNNGRRPILDVQITLRLSCPSLVVDGTTEWITLAEHKAPSIAPGSSRRWRVRLERDGVLNRYTAYLTDGLSDRIRRGDPVTMQAFIEMCPGTQLHCYATATDPVSGSRALSHVVIGKDELREGRFADTGCGHTGVLRDGTTTVKRGRFLTGQDEVVNREA
jgi:hypothetical protein